MGAFSLLATFTAFTLVILSASALELSSDGKYSIKVGVMYNSTEIDETKLNGYLGNIKSVLTQFSMKLFMSTNEKFFLGSVEILKIRLTGSAATLSFQGADIRVSDAFSVPHTENPNLCGQPGEYIELPLDFFKDRNGGAYGDHVKALLALWARFRWGVWEEHGFPQDIKFPYFYKETPAQQWSTSGCSNEPLVGDVVNEYGEISEECNVTNDESLPDTCRFIPDPAKNTATSSLMHFHYLETVNEFCDEETHDRDSPNRQNLFCSYKSIWEILRLTPDYLKVTRTESIDVPVIDFVETLKSQETVLYILLDKSKIAFENVDKKIKDGLVRMLNEISSTTVAALGTFPSTSAEPYVTEAISWTPLGDRTDFESVIRGPASESNHRDFGLAIQEAAEAIRRRDAGGAVILVVKMGVAPNSFSNMTIEEEVLADIRSTQLKIVSIEFSQNHTAPNTNLEKFAEDQTIRHQLITPSNIDGTDFPEIGRTIQSALTPFVPVDAPRSTVIYKGKWKPLDILPVMIRPGIAELRFRVTALATVNPYPIGNPGETIELPRPEWGEARDSTRRVVVGTTLTTTPEQVTNGFEWSYRYICDDNENTEADIIVYGFYADSHPPESDNVQITVFTSAPDNVLNFNHTANSESPFTIFARATLNEAPVVNLTVTAVIRQKTGTESWSIQLYDKGYGNPDVLADDGIYSGTFIPPYDGAYRISVQAKNNGPASMRRFERVSDLVRLIPIDQSELICEGSCGTGVSTDYALEVSADLPGTLRVENRADFQQTGKPIKIYTLEENKEESNGQFVRLRFNKPALLGNVQADITYSIYVVKNKADLYNESALTPNSTDINPTPGDGIQQEISVPLSDVSEPDDFFIAIKAHNGIQVSALSNIISVHFDPSSTTMPPSSSESTTAITPSTDPSASTPTVPPGATGSSTYASDPTGPSTTPMAEEDKPFFKTGAGIAVIVLIVVIGLAVLGGGAWYFMKKRKGSTMESA